MAWATGLGALLLCASAAAEPVLLLTGDSLSEGYGIDASQRWPHLLQQRLSNEADPKLNTWTVANVAVSGSTSAEGLARLPMALHQYHPQILLIELGGNDGLRGYPLSDLRANLEQLIDLGEAAGARPVLMEMRIPEVHGAAYSSDFNAVYSSVARARRVALVPFFLAPLLADRARWFQPDQIHPTAPAQPLMLDAAWSTLKGILASAAAS